MGPRTRKPSTLALTVRVALVSGIASAVLLAGLVWQMLAGADPALQPAGASGSTGSGSATTALSSSGDASAGSASQSASAPVVSTPAPVTTSSS